MYYSYDPEDGIEFHETEELAKEATELAKERAEFHAADSDWHWEGNEGEICWGVVKGQVSVNDRELTREEKEENPDWSFVRELSIDPVS